MASQPFDINAYIAAMQQMAQAQQANRTQNNREAQSGRHLGIGGSDVSTDNPQGYASNPFGGPLTFQNKASQLSPEAALASQGNNAMNQWGQVGQVAGVDAAKLQGLNQLAGNMQGANPHPMPSAADGAMAASPGAYTPVQGAFAPPAPLMSPDGPMNGMSEQQAMQGYLAQAQPGFFTMRPQTPQLPQDQPPQQPRRPGFKAGATARPGSSFSFGAGGMR